MTPVRLKLAYIFVFLLQCDIAYPYFLLRGELNPTI